MQQNYKRTTCPRDCYDGCGIRVEYSENQTFRAMGDPNHPVAKGSLCQKCAIGYNTTWQDPHYRLLHPLRCIGRKGAGELQRITWDDALREIATKVNYLLDSYGGKSITNIHYTGTCSVVANELPQRFFKKIGAVEIDGDTICNKAGHVALSYLFGTSRHGFDPRTMRDAHSLILWGCNPSHSAPRTNSSFIEALRIKTIVVDPIRHETAAKATIHMRPFPGSDAALAFGMLRMIADKSREDKAFIKAHVVGFDELRDALELCTPIWTEARTGVPIEQIQAAVDLYLEGPALLWLGQGLARQHMGGNAIRACALLPVITGNIGKRGTGFCFLNDTQSIAQGSVFYPGYSEPSASGLSHMDLVDHLSNQKTRCVFIWNMNPAISAPRQHELRQLLEHNDLFTVVIDCFKTATVECADIALPASTFFEFDDLVWNYFHFLLGYQSKILEPMGESLPNQEIFRRLAKVMGLNETDLQESDDDVIKSILDSLASPITITELAAKGWLEVGVNPHVQFKDNVFPTPSGKIEIASERASRDGLPRCPLPHFDAVIGDGTFRLLTPASRWTLNSVFADNPLILARAHLNRVFVHPSDAKILGVSDGHILKLWNSEGEIELEALLSDVTVPGVLLSHKTAHDHTDSKKSINILNPGEKSDMGGSSSVHAIRVFAKCCKSE